VWQQHKLSLLLEQITNSVGTLETLREGKDSDLLQQDLKDIRDTPDAFEVFRVSFAASSHFQTHTATQLPSALVLGTNHVSTSPLPLPFPSSSSKGFYNELASTRAYHSKFSAQVAPPAKQRALGYADVPDVSFSGEEVFGKYLDLHEQYQLYRNIPDDLFREEVDYLGYLERVPDLAVVPEDKKGSKAYGAYVESLCSYLAGFCVRVRPLEDLTLGALRQSFELDWSRGEVPGWRSGGSGDGGGGGVDVHTDVDPNDGAWTCAADIVASAGGERLKAALEARGLKCGGTAADRAQRLWAVRGLSPDEYPKKLRAKGTMAIVAAANGGGGEAGAQAQARAVAGMATTGRKAVAWAEYRVAAMLSGPLEGMLADTARHVLKQQTRTPEEKARELEEEEAGLLEALALDDDDDGANDVDAPTYNPSKLYLGWDGKPIPYWMYVRSSHTSMSLSPSLFVFVFAPDSDSPHTAHHTITHHNTRVGTACMV
jgi:splicing factor 3A subunit 3